MKLKNISINFILIFSSIYIPLILFSFFNTFQNTLINKKWNQKKSSDKISAVNSGYLPTFNPSIISLNINPPPVYPIGSLPNTPTYLCDEGYGLITYHSDRFGLRNSDLNWDNIYNQSNIFVIGDSFVHGACVEENATITRNIERLTKQNTLNLGMSGNSPYEYIAILKSIIKPIINNTKQRNKVVMVFYANDNVEYIKEKEKLLFSSSSIIDSLNGKKVSPKDYYIRKITEFIKTNYPQSKRGIMSEIQKKEKKKFKDQPFYQIISLYPIRLRLGFLNLLNKPPSTKNSNKTSTKKSISSLSEICKSSCTPIIAYIPNSPFLYPIMDVKEYKRHLKEISMQNGIEFIDGEDVIDKNDLNNYSPKGPHLSISGYKKIATYISAKLKKYK